MAIIEQYQKLNPVAQRLYGQMDELAQVMLLPAFALSCLLAYSRDLGLQGAVASRLKRLVITALLLAAFPQISSFIKDLGQQIAHHLDDMNALDTIFKLAAHKYEAISERPSTLLTLQHDFMIGLFVSASMLILTIARFGLVAFYHFYWLILIATAPLLILGNLFETSSTLTKNLFKNLILVASWPIVWAILSVFLKSLPFEDLYTVEGGFLSVIAMNLILAVSLILSPFMLSQFCEGTIVGAGSMVYSGAKAVVSTVLPKTTILGAMGMAQGASAGRRFAGAASHGSVSRFYSKTKAAPETTSPKSPNTPPSGKSLLVLFAIAAGVASLASPALAQLSPKSINIHPGLGSVVCLEAPDSATIVDQRFFRAQTLPASRLLVYSLKPDKTTDLVISTKKEFRSYRLTSNVILPHAVSIDCETAKAVGDGAVASTAKRTQPTPILGQQKTTSGISLILRSLQWSNAKRDYLNLRLEVANRSPRRLRPNWKGLNLRQGDRKLEYSKLYAERQAIEPGTITVFRVEFTRPSLARTSGATLEVDFSGEKLALPISKELLK